MTEIKKAIDAFVTAIRQAGEMEARVVPLKDFKSRTTASAQEWRNNAGVYLFIWEGRVVYVGKALSTGLRKEIMNQMRVTSNPRWVRMIADEKTSVCVIPFPHELWFLSSAMEPFLIERFGSKYLFNERKQ